MSIYTVLICDLFLYHIICFVIFSFHTFLKSDLILVVNTYIVIMLTSSFSCIYFKKKIIDFLMLYIVMGNSYIAQSNRL
jgi:hypothetical protein